MKAALALLADGKRHNGLASAKRGARAGGDSVSEQKKLEATLCEMLAVGAARRPFGRQSPASSARGVGRFSVRRLVG